MLLPPPPPPQEVYSAPSFAAQFDCVATCFFIDTAHNLLEYMEVIHAVLRPGGKWVNLGPLLYHWADTSSEVRQGHHVPLCRCTAGPLYHCTAV